MPTSTKPLGTLLLLLLRRRRRNLSTSSAAVKTPERQRAQTTPKKNMSAKHRGRVVEQAQSALAEYLHATRSVPFTFAELIAANSPSSLAALIASAAQQPSSSSSSFAKTFQKLLRYRPINEFEFFFESIGIGRHELRKFLHPKRFFFVEDSALLDSAGVLSGFGFPWNMLGLLYEEEPSVFAGTSSDDLVGRLEGFKERYEIGNLAVVGACLAFPGLLRLENEPMGWAEIDEVFRDLKKVFAGFDMGRCVEGNVGPWYEVCRKVRVFYGLGCEKGKDVGVFMCKRKEAFLRCPVEVLARKAEYFGRFGVGTDEVGLLLLRRPEILSLDLETPVISVARLLKRFGLEKDELRRVGDEYPHVFGRNEMANLPSVMRALNLHRWCFDKIKNSDAKLLETCGVSFPEQDSNKEFADALKKLGSSRCSLHSAKKVEFVKRIGFGENGLTVKVLNSLKGSGDGLQKRFDYLLGAGIEYSKLCLLMKTAPRIFGQCPDMLEQKVSYLLGEMGCSLEYLDIFPGILCFDLDRIKFRHRFNVWLRESGLCKREYSTASIIATSENRLIARLFAVHPVILKHYLERFAHRKFAD